MDNLFVLFLRVLIKNTNWLYNEVKLNKKYETYIFENVKLM